MSIARKRAMLHESELSPEARLERAARQITAGVVAAIQAELARTGAATDWVDQYHSPLGKNKHLRLVRAGVLPSRKEGKQLLVRRDDMNAYIEKHGLARGVRTETEEVDDVVDELVKGSGGR